ncbi:hypothetical protein H0266_04140 [Halobacillus locisalis]|uniref:Uncharacterized protein n=1 Tax=Halobacillus locisalis TaxID=220753 RepID=A0A838CPU8_9BACI|nr:hypothetical protein [Halobacillus locisalis]MBA2174087.1 hypothetical protein [Halobacillus locisalis]
MAGSVLFNLLFAVFGFLFMFLFSLTANVWQTSIIRGTIGFFLFFIVAFVFRLLWELISEDKEKEAVDMDGNEHERQTSESGEVKGSGELPEATAKQTSEMIRSLLSEEEAKTTTND